MKIATKCANVRDNYVNLARKIFDSVYEPEKEEFQNSKTKFSDFKSMKTRKRNVLQKYSTDRFMKKDS